MQRTRLRGARTNNLKNLDLELRPGTLTVIAGPSGAGKSSLAFGTLYAEGQRRYVESFSAYARQFLERLARPPVDELEPVPAGVAVDRQAPVKTSRSTVGTMTEIADYAKELWARLASLECPTCRRPVRRDTPTSAAREVMRRHPERRIMVTYPVHVSDAAEFLGVREALLADGYRRLRVDGTVRDLDEVRPSDVFGAETASLEVVADRLVASEERRRGGMCARGRLRRAFFEHAALRVLRRLVSRADAGDVLIQQPGRCMREVSRIWAYDHDRLGARDTGRVEVALLRGDQSVEGQVDRVGAA
jgi:excinuclease ABC subunit A